MRRPPQRGTPRRTALLGVCLALAGCATYKPRPITDEALRKALTPPDLPALRVPSALLGVPTPPPLALDWKKGLTPDGAAVLAVLLNPSLRAERDRRGLARAQLLQAGILPNPQLGLSTDLPVGSNPPDTVTAYGLGLSWDVAELVSRSATKKAARATVAQVDLEVAWSEWQAAEAAKMAVYDLLALQEQLALERRVVASWGASAALLQRAQERHDATLPERSAAEAALREAEISVARTQGDLRSQEVRLKRALGLPPDATVQLARGLSLPPALTPAVPKDLLHELQRRRLDLDAQLRGYESQEETVHAAVLAQFPRINLGFNHASDTSAVHTVGFGLTVDLPLFDRNQGRIAIERATRQELFDEYVSRLARARADFADAVAALRGISDREKALKAAIPALQRLVDVYRRAVSEKSADVLSYRQAEIDLLQKRLQFIQLRREGADATVALELSSGTYMPAKGTEPKK